MKESVYLYNFTDSEDNIHSLGEYMSKVILIFNGAIHSKFAPLFFYRANEIYQELKDEGLVIINFPTSSFLNQNEEDTLNTIKYLKENYNISFLTAKKIEDDLRNQVLFHNLENMKKFNGFSKSSYMYDIVTTSCSKVDPLFEQNNKIKWSFTSFVISKDGYVNKRFECTEDFDRIEKSIRKELDK